MLFNFIKSKIPYAKIEDYKINDDEVYDVL